MYPRAPISTSALRIASSCTARLPHPQGTFVRIRASHYFSHVSRACKVGIGPLLLAFIPTQSSLCARPEKNGAFKTLLPSLPSHWKPVEYFGRELSLFTASLLNIIGVSRLCRLAAPGMMKVGLSSGGSWKTIGPLPRPASRPAMPPCLFLRDWYQSGKSDRRSDVQSPLSLEPGFSISR